MRINNIFSQLIIISILLISARSVNAQTTRNYRSHEVINIGNGMRAEILSCRGIGDDAECDVIIYKENEKRQNGKRSWEKAKSLRTLELIANNLSSVVKPPAIKAPAKSEIAKVKSETVKDEIKPAPKKLTKPLKTESKVVSVIKQEPEKIKVKDESQVIVSVQTPFLATKETESHNNLVPKVMLSTSTNQYTLEDCFKLALERNLNVKRSENNITNAYIDNKAARASLLPNVSYDLGHYFSFGKNIDPVTNTFVFDNFSGGYTALGLQLELFSGFKKINSIRQSEYLLKAAEYTKKQAQFEIVSNVSLQYARLLFDLEQINVERKNISNTTRQLELVNEKIKVGRQTKYDGFTISARMSTDQANLLTAQNDSALAVQQLKHLLNFSPDQEFAIAPFDTTELNNISTSSFSPAQLVQEITEKHPLLMEAKMKQAAALAGEKIAKSYYYPSLSVGGNIVSNYNANQLNSNGDKVGLGETN